MSWLQNIQSKIANLPILKAILQWAKTHSLPGFDNIPLYDVVVFFIREIQRDSIVTRANSIAFSFFMSLFPMLLVFFTLIPFLLPYFQGYILPFIAEDLVVKQNNGVINFNQTLIAQFDALITEVNVIPSNVRQQLLDFITEVLLQPRFGLLSFGFVLALFFSSNGMLTMMQGFEKGNRHTFFSRNALARRLIAIELTFIIGGLVFAAILFVILGNTGINWLLGIIHGDGFVGFAIQILRVLTMFFLFYFGISFLYRKGAPTHQKFKYFTPGATLATFLALITSWGFAIYVNNYSKYNDLYGSIGTFIVIMIWIQMNAFILLIGFELNASIAVNRDLKKVRSKKRQQLKTEEE